MLLKFLDKVVSSLPNFYRSAVEKVLASKEGTVSTRNLAAEARKYEEKLRAGIENTKPLYYKKGEKISSNKHNHNSELTYIFLSALSKYIEVVSAEANKNLTIIDSEFNKANDSFQELLNTSRAYALRRSNPEYNYISIVPLNNNYSDDVNGVWVSPESNTVRAGVRSQTSAHVADHTSADPSVSLELISDGVRTNLHTIMPPENVLGANLESAWADSVISNGLIRQEYQGKKYNGPIALMTVELAVPQKINHIKLHPFGNYPIKVEDIEYKDSNSNEWEPVPDFNPLVIETSTDVSLSAFSASTIRLLLVQENFTEISYKLPKDQSNRLSTFLALIEAKNKSKEDISKYYIEEIPASILNEALDSLSELNSQVDEVLVRGKESKVIDTIKSKIEELLTNYQDSQNTVEVTGLEYLMGLRSLEFNLIDYIYSSHYRSDEINPGATVTDLALHTTEDYQGGETSVEWSIDLGRDKKLPIIPINTAKIGGDFVVENERMHFKKEQDYIYHVTRFPATGKVFYQVNGSWQPNSGITETQLSDDRYSILIPDVDFSSTYTVNYRTPAASAELDIDNEFDSVPLSIPEKIQNSGPNNEVSLEYCPYIDYSIVNLTGDFDYENNKFKYTAPQDPYTTGHVKIWPTVLDDDGSTMVSGVAYVSGLAPTYNVVGITNGPNAPDFDLEFGTNGNLSGAYYSGQYSYFIHIDSIGEGYKFTGVDQADSDILRLLEVPIMTKDQALSINQSGFSGDLQNSPYSCELEVPVWFTVGISGDGTVYGYDNNEYEPLVVTVGGIKATNLTNYRTFEHTAFDIPAAGDINYQYIQAGNTLYFNQPVNDIEVTYRWMTKHIALEGRFNVGSLYKSETTPVVSDAYLLMNTSII